MTGYTKEQEAEALQRVVARVGVDMTEVRALPWSQYLVRDIAIVAAMAKRTAEAEAERDALKARVAELERAHEEVCYAAWCRVNEPAPTPSVVVTREVWEAMHEFMEVTGMFIPDASVAAQAVRTRDAICRMLEVKPHLGGDQT